MDKKRKVLELLLEERNKNGYLIVDQLLDYCDIWNLNLLESNWVSEQVSQRNIVFLEKEPESISIQKDDEAEDRARVDYEIIYEKVIELDQGLKPLVETIKKIRPPQVGEFKELRDHIVEGNRFARKRLIEMYMRTVIKIALNTSQTFNLNISDAIQDGFLGLIQSVDSISDETSVVFQRNTNWCIYNAIKRGYINTKFKFRLPVHLQEKFEPVVKRLEKKKCFECSKFGKCLQCENMVLKEFEQDKGRLETFRNLYYPAYPTEDLTDYLSEDKSLYEDLTINSTNEIIQKVQDEHLQNILKNELTPKELKILTERYGLEGSKALTLQEVGEEMGVTRERIRQIESRALRRLRIKCGKLLS